MSLITRLRDAFDALQGHVSVPQIEALGMSMGGEIANFASFDDPSLIRFFQGGRETSSGIVVNERLLLRNSASHRALNLISGTIGMLPLPLYRKTQQTRERPAPTPDDPEATERVTTEGAEPATDHPLWRILRKKPNGWQTPFEFWSYMTQRALLKGISYAVKRTGVSARSRTGMALKELIPLNPDWVEPKMERDWRLHFIYHDPWGSPIDISVDQMFWFRSPISSDGVTGAALLDVAAEAIGVSSQAERASGRVLKNGAIVGGVLEHPKALSEDAIDRLRTQFEERQSTPENAGKWIVAEDGLKAQPFGSSLKDAQNAEIRKFQVEELGRFTGVPRPLLMMDETSWGTGIEQLGLFLVTYCLLPWFVNIEQAISRSLLSETETDQYYAKFNEGALLRGSLKDQAEFFAKALGTGGGRGWMTQNEVRDKSELNPMEGGDELPEPAGKGAPQDAPADPQDTPGGAGQNRPSKSNQPGDE
jgi:HK97 family phage portal protein